MRHKRLPLGQQVAPRLAGSQIAAGQRHRRESTQLFTVAVADPQALPAPQFAVFSLPDPVQHQRNHISAIARPAVFGQTCRRVGVVMPHLMLRIRHLRPKLGGAIAGMGIGHYPFGGELPEILNRIQGLLPLGQRVVIA
ncbi:hypothetical protein D3C75_842420 [compost metagenome]